MKEEEEDEEKSCLKKKGNKLSSDKACWRAGDG